MDMVGVIIQFTTLGQSFVTLKNRWMRIQKEKADARLDSKQLADKGEVFCVYSDKGQSRPGALLGECRSDSSGTVSNSHRPHKPRAQDTEELAHSRPASHRLACTLPVGHITLV